MNNNNKQKYITLILFFYRFVYIQYQKLLNKRGLWRKKNHIIAFLLRFFINFNIEKINDQFFFILLIQNFKVTFLLYINKDNGLEKNDIIGHITIIPIVIQQKTLILIIIWSFSNFTHTHKHTHTHQIYKLFAVVVLFCFVFHSNKV